MAKLSGAKDIVWNDQLFTEGIEYIKYLFQIENILDDQKIALTKFFKGKDIHFSAPTGYGKSLVFQAIPIIADHLLEQAICTSSILVISPLQSLMFDQVAYLNSVGVSAAAIFDGQEEEILKNIEEGGVYSVIFASPESMLSIKRWRQLLSSESFTSSCVGVAVDEAHCITQWGMTTNLSSPFRKWYGHIGELRSLLDSSVKFAVFTATASKSTKASLLTVLNMKPLLTHMIEKSPLKDNLTFHVSYINNDMKLEDIFNNVIREIKFSGDKTERTIIFCQTRNQCALLRRMFMLQLGKKFFKAGEESPHFRLVEMFHAGTPKSVKEHVLTEMRKVNSCLRIFICTIAFGMGIDCKDVHRIIHFGPSKTLESYLQKCGRAGRDNLPSICYLLYNGFLASHCSSEIKKFVNSKYCRRTVIAENFPACHDKTIKNCSCCDVCFSQCQCQQPCHKKVITFNKSFADNVTVSRSRTVTSEQKKALQERLINYKEEYKQIVSGTLKPVSCPSLLLEFGDLQIQSCNCLFTLDDIIGNVEIWRAIHANNILVALSETFKEIDIDTSNLLLSDPELQLEDELDDQWLDIRDDSNITLLADSFQIEELDKVMEEHDTSGVNNISMNEIIDYATVKPNLLHVIREETAMETD